MSEHTVRELKSEAEWRVAFPVMKQLRTHLDEGAFVSLVGRLQVDGYRLFGLFEAGDGDRDGGGDSDGDGDLRAVAGVAIEHTLYDGRRVWVYDLVTDEAHRSRGLDEELYSFVERWAGDRGCETVTLSSNLERSDAHRFYEERLGMERARYVFKRDL
jgi:GNAT superfamily N-acetyltransferase